MRKPTAQFIVRVCIRYKHIRDTIKMCNHEHQAWGPYTHGQIEPHFQMPTTLGSVFMGSNIVAVTQADILLWDGSSAEWLKE